MEVGFGVASTELQRRESQEFFVAIGHQGMSECKRPDQQIEVLESNLTSYCPTANVLRRLSFSRSYK